MPYTLAARRRCSDCGRVGASVAGTRGTVGAPSVRRIPRGSCRHLRASFRRVRHATARAVVQVGLTGVGVARARTVHRALDAVEPVDDSLTALELAAAPRG